MNSKLLPRTQIALALLLIALRPAFAGEDQNPVSSPDALAAEAKAKSAESAANYHKAKLDKLDHEIDAIDERLDHMPESPDREAAKERLAVLKDRRTELRKAYIGSKFDQLKADIQKEYEQVSAWTKAKYQDITEDDDDAVAKTSAQVDAAANTTANAARVKVTIYQMNPSPENKADVKRALDALDDEIDRLDDRAEALPEGAQRTALENRIEALEDREDELEHNFTKARWDALVADVKHEWDQLIH